MFENYTEADLEAGRRALGGGGVGARVDLVVDRGEGAVLYDKKGKAYIDCTSQAWSLNIGYSHPKVVAAVGQAIKEYTHIRTSFETVPKLLLSKKLVEIAPGNLNKVMYAVSGSDANEGSIKVAMRNRPGNTFASLFDGYHGRTLAMLNLSYPHPNNRFLGWSADVIRLPQPYAYRYNGTPEECVEECIQRSRELILRGASERPVCLMMEPLQGNGGMVEFPRSYFSAIRNLCDELGMLLVFDEIQTGFGRMGTWTAAEYYGTAPDIMTIGKGLGGGYPLFGNLYDSKLKDLETGDHSFTFAHFPIGMVAALATIQVIEEENLLQRSQEMGKIITSGLLELKNHYELIGDVRGPGLMIGVELVKDRKTKEPAREEAHHFIQEGLKRGVIFGESKYLGMGNIIKVKPPLVINETQCEQVLDVFKDILEVLSPRH